MTNRQARERAAQVARATGLDMYVVLECGDYDYCTEYQLHTFYSGARIVSIFEPDGTESE